MQCPQCGDNQPAENMFCTKCGARLSAAPPSPPPEEQPGEFIAVSSSAKEEEEKILKELKEALKGVEPDKTSDEATSERRSSGTKKLIWIGAILGVTIVGVIATEMFLRRGHETVSSPPPPIEAVRNPEPVAAPALDDSLRTTVGKISAILEGIQRYSTTKKVLPPSLVSLNRSFTDPDTLKDGWGQNLVYLVDLTNKTYVVRSPGPDGKRQTSDDIWVDSDNREEWVREHKQVIDEWRVANPNLYAQLSSAGPSPDDLQKQQAARKLEEDKKREQAEASTQAQKQEEQKRLETARLEEEKRKQAEAQKREEEQRQAKLREEALKKQQMAHRPESVKESFIDGLGSWDAPPTWELIKDKENSALRVQGLGFLKKGEQWDNYKIDFEVKINKESAGWVLRAQNSNNFYLFKLASEKAKAIPKNSLVKYIRADDKYLNSLKREDAPGAAGVTPLSFKVRSKDYYKVTVMVKGNTITHYVDGIQVDAWTDDTFTHGRFGFNASAIEQATIRSVSVEPIR